MSCRPPARSPPRRPPSTPSTSGRPGSATRWRWVCSTRRPASGCQSSPCRGRTWPWPATPRSGAASRRCAAAGSLSFSIPRTCPMMRAPPRPNSPGANCGPRSGACAPRLPAAASPQREMVPARAHPGIMQAVAADSRWPTCASNADVADLPPRERLYVSPGWRPARLKRRGFPTPSPACPARRPWPLPGRRGGLCPRPRRRRRPAPPPPGRGRRSAARDR